MLLDADVKPPVAAIAPPLIANASASVATMFA
jgi:hypothetical protein